MTAEALHVVLGTRHRPRFQAPFNHPTSAAAAADGEIYVADGYGNSAVHRFSADTDAGPAYPGSEEHAP